ncbi:MAG TPA: hypothetical protein VKP11_05075 [Frankiaceae bacterium]|nr:hypothetical protein [Frankiaceae bacterium]
MSAGWVAGSVRARALARRRIGRAGARDLASCGSLEEATAMLAQTPYGRTVRPDQGLPDTQRAVAEALLWHLRVLAGWLPADGKQKVRLLAGWFELANIEDHAAALAGERSPPPFRLGALSTVWLRAARAATLAELRDVLATSPWGDCGEQVDELRLRLRLAWARRLGSGVPEVSSHVAGATALLVARDLFAGGRLLVPGSEARRPGVPGMVTESVVGAASVAELARLLPRAGAWALEGVAAPDGLWLAEARWWQRVESDSFAWVAGPRSGPRPVLGVLGLLAVDAWRVGAALEMAARGGARLEVFDAVG